jgi:hypothetical protein
MSHAIVDGMMGKSKAGELRWNALATMKASLDGFAEDTA